MKLQRRTLLLLSMFWAGFSACGAYATVTGPGGSGGQGGGTIQVKVPSAAPRIIVGKGTIGIVCRSSEGTIQMVHILDKPDSIPESVLLDIEASWHMKYPSSTDELADGADCTVEHVSQEDVDSVQGQAPSETPTPEAQ